MNSKRIEFIDALRGFTMFLVVFWHVMALSFNIDSKESIVGDIFLTFRMPMFFFISGFLGGGKTLDTRKLYYNSVRRKAFVQLVPTAIFFSIFHLTHNSSPLVFFTEGLTGYWFTLVLFELFLTYYTIQFLFGNRPRVFLALMVTFAVLGQIISLYINTRPVMPQLCKVLTLNNFFYYFQFFCLGIIVKTIKEIYNFLTDQRTFGFTVLLFVIVFYLKHNIFTHDFNNILYYFLDSIAIRYIGLIMIFSGFSLMQSFFEQNGTFSRTIQFVGKRTLDIYLIHYFFIYSLSDYKHLFVSGTSEFIIGEIFVFGLLTIAIIFVSLLISSFLRNSSFLSKILFGVFPKK